MRLYKIIANYDYTTYKYDDFTDYGIILADDIDRYQMNSLTMNGFYLGLSELNSSYFIIDIDFPDYGTYNIVSNYRDEILSLLRDELINNILDENL
jgi:hypothetical protein